MGTLVVATEGCCAGHECDHCKVCQRGRCCRKDNPQYQLPELGEWDGPIFGQLGVLADDGDKAECHCCGEFHGHLGNHVWMRHNLTADEYRAIFGLRQKTGLIGPRLRAIRQKDSSTPERLAVLETVRTLGIHEATPEQRSAWSKGRRQRLASKIDPVVQASRAEAARKSGERLKAAYASGERTPRPIPPEQTRNANLASQKRMKELRQDPEWVKRTADKISVGKLRYHAQITRVPWSQERVCPICETTFTVERHTRRKHCSRPCLIESRRRNSKAANVMQRPEMRAMISRRAKANHARGVYQRNPDGSFKPRE